MSKNLIWNIVVLSCIAILAWSLFFKEKEIEFIKGETVTVTINQSKFDSLEYSYTAKVDSLLKIKPTIKYVSSGTTVDTVVKYDTVYLSYWTLFNFGDDTLGTSGKVTFDMEDFKFSNIEYRYPKEFSTRVDTMKIVQAEDFYKDTWFWTTVASAVLLFLSLLGGK